MKSFLWEKVADRRAVHGPPLYGLTADRPDSGRGRGRGPAQQQAGAAFDAADWDCGARLQAAHQHKTAPGHRRYPYLLRNVVIERPNQVWAADITYIPIGRGCLYLVAIMNWASRVVLAWWVSNTMDVSFCVSAIEEALSVPRHAGNLQHRPGKPDRSGRDSNQQADTTGPSDGSTLVIQTLMNSCKISSLILSNCMLSGRASRDNVALNDGGPFAEHAGLHLQNLDDGLRHNFP